jgi:hypothetical protein
MTDTEDDELPQTAATWFQVRPVVSYSCRHCFPIPSFNGSGGTAPAGDPPASARQRQKQQG